MRALWMLPGIREGDIRSGNSGDIGKEDATPPLAEVEVEPMFATYVVAAQRYHPKEYGWNVGWDGHT